MSLKRQHKDLLVDIQLAGPATLAMLVLIFIPTLMVGILSFTDYLFGALEFNWIGLDNYIALLSDETGRKAVVNTLIYVSVVMPLSIILSLLAAVGVHSVGQWNMNIANTLRTAYFMPVVATLVAMATVWQMLLHPSLGLINQFIGVLGIPAQEWLSDQGMVLYTLAGIGVWETVGYNMVLFLAGLVAIPSSLYDAAEVDGAGNGWDRFWTVTWPMLGPTTLFVLVVTATRSFRVFETVATMTNGGPGFASDVLVFAMYREGFVYFKAGYSGALTMVFFFFVLSLTLLQLRLAEKKVHYR